jgi:hypothetical protein
MMLGQGTASVIVNLRLTAELLLSRKFQLSYKGSPGNMHAPTKQRA